MAELDDRLGDRSVFDVILDTAHERLIDLEPVDRKFLEIAHRRETSTEVVDRQFDADGVELVERLDDRLDARHDHALGDLQLE